MRKRIKQQYFDQYEQAPIKQANEDKLNNEKYIEIRVNDDIEGERAISFISIKDVQCVTYDEFKEELKISCGGIISEIKCEYKEAMDVINRIKSK